MTSLHRNKEYYSNTEWTVDKVRKEIENGLILLNSIDQKIVAFFGSHMVQKNNDYYKHCKNLAYELGQKDYAILTGGGPGIMHAANSGATEAEASSIGLMAELLKGEKVIDNIFTHELSFHFIFVRRFIMAIKSEALIFYPGGFGTLNELFEYATLMQTNIVDAVPIICVNEQYWKGLFNWLEDSPLKNCFLTKENMNLLYFADYTDSILNIIENE